MRLKLALILSTLFISSCSTSLVYSPALDLATHPLVRGEGSVMLGGELLPETRPDAVRRFATLGLNGSIKYGFSNWFSLQFKTWWATSTLNSSIRQGYAGSAIVMLNNESNSTRLALLPTFAFLFSGKSNDGQGIALPFAAWLPPVQSLHPYLGIGPAIGWRSLAAGYGVDGYGVIGNVGASYELTHTMSLSAKVSAVYAINRSDAITTFVISPKLSLGWLF